MAVYTTNGLLPGTIDTMMPSFVPAQVSSGSSITKCTVTFRISKYDEIEDIKQNYVQVSLRYNNTNLNALSDASGIVLKSYITNADGSYSFELLSSDLKEGSFKAFQYYKLQFRLTDISATDKGSTQTIDEWLKTVNETTGKTNLEESTEWSTVCAIHPITEPECYIDQFGDPVAKIFNGDLQFITGNISFESADADEYLKNYQVQIYDGSDDVVDFNTGTITSYTDGDLIEESEIIYKGNEEKFKYIFKTDFEPNHMYNLHIKFTTNNLYTEDEVFVFKENITEGTWSPTPAVSINYIEEEGIIKLSLNGTLPSDTNTIKILRTTMSNSAYTAWETLNVKTFTSSGSAFTYSYYDDTVESGMLYKYKITALNGNGTVVKTGYTSANPVGLMFDDMFLLNQDKQLKISYDQKVSSFKTILSENKTETLGSQYPFIRRNGDIHYKSFPISGLISFQNDNNNVFTTKAELFGNENLTNYTALFDNYSINDKYNRVLERKFREKVEEFLIDGNPKLFRTETEGNIIVRLMDVNLTPKDQLGRLIYNFSATAYEVADYSINNLNELNIKNINKEYNYATLSNIDINSINKDDVVLPHNISESI